MTNKPLRWTWKDESEDLVQWRDDRWQDIMKAKESKEDLASITIILTHKTPAATTPQHGNFVTGLGLKNLVIVGVGLLFLINSLLIVAPESSDIFMIPGTKNLRAMAIAAKEVFFGNESVTKVPGQFSWKEGDSEFLSFVQELKTKYWSQTEYGRAQIDSAISSTMTVKIPGKPACLLFLTPPTVPASFTRCYARTIGRKVNWIFSKIDSNLLKGAGGDVLQLGPQYWDKVANMSQVHEDLNTYFNTQGKVVIIDEVDKLNKQDQLHLLHAYCDNAKAPDTRATIIFSIKIHQDLKDDDGKVGGVDWKDGNGHRVAAAILNSAWTSLSDDARPAIINRVTATVVLIQPGDVCHSGTYEDRQ